jgi:predicted ATP-binding protein involved in virulence
MTKAPLERKKAGKRKSRTDYPPAYFLSLELENVLCFKSRQRLDLTDANGFPAQWTVILGDNGVGKTTLLQSLAGMTHRTSPEFVSFNLDGKIVTMAQYRLFKLDESLIESRNQNNRTEIHATLTFASSLREPANAGQESLEFSIKTDKNHSANVSYPNKELPGLNCYGYGANRKMSKTPLLKKALASDSCESLLSDDESLINAEEWLLQADYAVARSTPEDKLKIEQQRFDTIQNILKNLLPDVSDIRITSMGEKYFLPTVEFLTPYGWVPLKNLSLGYKTMIAWMVDLAARLMDRYPDSEDPLAEPAVVLVDEIDLHLHPKWQRTIMSFLTERFPNTQFIVTAHSPLVVQAAKDANIVLLRREGDHVVIDNDPEIIDNWRVDQVLTSIFELPTPHPPDIEPLIERRRALLSKPKLTAKDQRELKDLEEKIGSLPTAESPEDIRAMDIIRKAAKLLENS